MVESGKGGIKFRFRGCQSVFRGRYEHTIDAKGRISIPSKFREVLSKKYDDRLVITNFDHCLVAFPYEEWSFLEQKVGTFSLMKKETSAFFRFFYSSAWIATLINREAPHSSDLRDYAGLQKDCRAGGRRKADRDLRQRAVVGGARKIEDNFGPDQRHLGNLI